MVRVKHRYLLISIDYHSKSSNDKTKHKSMDGKQLENAILHSVSNIHGDFGVGSVLRDLRTKYINPKTHIAIVRVGREAHKVVASTLPFISSIGKFQCSIRLIHVGGTIRSCNKFLLKHHQQEMTLSSKFLKKNIKVGSWKSPK